MERISIGNGLFFLVSPKVWSRLRDEGERRKGFMLSLLPTLANPYMTIVIYPSYKANGIEA